MTEKEAIELLNIHKAHWKKVDILEEKTLYWSTT